MCDDYTDQGDPVPTLHERTLATAGALALNWLGELRASKLGRG